MSQLTELRSALQIVQGRRRRFEIERRDLEYVASGAKRMVLDQADSDELEALDERIDELDQLEERLEVAAVKLIEAELERYEGGETP